MKISEFEDAVWATEGIRIVVRSPEAKTVNDYEYKKAAQETWRVGQWLDNRVRPKLGNREVVVVQGDGEQPHGRVILRTLRGSYDRA